MQHFIPMSIDFYRTVLSIGILFVTASACSEQDRVAPVPGSKESLVETIDEFSFIDLVEGATVIEEPTDYRKIDTAEVAILGDTRKVLFHHPPSSIEFQPIELGRKASLEFAIALNPTAWNQAGDGVTFKILARYENGAESEIYSRYIDPKHNPEQRRWIDERVDLSRFQGQPTQFIFQTDPGPENNTYFDWSVWGNPKASSVRSIRIDRNQPTRWPARKNVLMVLIDTLRADHVGTYGYSRSTTPNLDAFLESSSVFENARSQASCTFPSVNSILTSRFPFEFISRGAAPATPDRDSTEIQWQSGNRPARFGIPEDLVSLPQLLVERGYFTAAVSASPIVRNESSEEATNRWGGFGRGFDVFNEECLNEKAHCVTAAAISTINSRPAERPFFLYLHYMDPHDPYGAPDSFGTPFSEPYLGRPYVEKGIPYPLATLVEEGKEKSIPTRDVQHLVDLYDDGIAYFDYSFGKLLDALDASGLLASTLIVVLSDHGESFLEHSAVAHCHTVFDSEVHTPLGVYVPNDLRGRRIRENVQNLDVVPTILDFLGLQSDLPEARGISLRLLMEGNPHREIENPSYSAQRGWRSVSLGHYKLIHDILTGSQLLFDLRLDPGELDNLSDEAPEELTSLEKLLFGHLVATEGSSASARSLELSEGVEEELRALGYFE